MTPAESAALARLAAIDDPNRLRAMIRNARAKGSTVVERAAFERLVSVQPAAARGTLEHDVWSSVHALEEMLGAERGRTTRLSRTRQKIARDGERKTVADLAQRAEPSEGFHLLVKRGHPELLFESVILRHPDAFDAETRAAARARLDAFGTAPDLHQDDS